MENEIIKINPKEFGLEPSKVKSIEEAFMPKITERNGLEVIYKELLTKEIDAELCEDAGNLRRKLVKVRTGIAEIHRSQKAFFLASGKFVDAWKNKETLPVTQMEENLQKIEKHYALIEQKRITALQGKRVKELSKYIEDAEQRILSSMDNDVWNAFLSTKKKEYNDKIEAEKKAEQERIAKELEYKKEQERIRKENEKLKKEAIERERLEKIAAAKRQEAEKQRLAKQEAERKAYELKLQKQREEKERIEREGKQKREELEAELRAKQEAERKRLEAKEKQIQLELSKGDADKIKDLINDLTGLKTKYEFKSNKNKAIYKNVGGLIDKVVNYINQ